MLAERIKARNTLLLTSVVYYQNLGGSRSKLCSLALLPISADPAVDYSEQCAGSDGYNNTKR